MAIQTCPTDIVAASPERIWGLLTSAKELAAWSGTKLLDGPHRALVAGDRVVLEPAFGMKVIIEVLGMELHRQLAVDAYLPLGVVNHEVFQISRLDDRRCRVTFN